ncbi:hypothetical protein D9V96_019565 [Zobellia laminariae]|uniref:hypothetical protein n=1 Tax=Zobellia laminariae TaxID=248906 RepID=UPI0012D85F78|nr:hypothetical protein [Zobellia laminariae]
MKYIFFTIFTISMFLYSTAQSSNSDELRYKADGIYMTFQDDSGKTVNKVPLGKSPNITFDSFFKSYYLNWKDENGQLGEMELSYIMTDENGYFKMQDTFGNIFHVANYMQSHGKLLVVAEQKVNGYFLVTQVEGIKRL